MEESSLSSTLSVVEESSLNLGNRGTSSGFPVGKVFNFSSQKLEEAIDESVFVLWPLVHISSISVSRSLARAEYSSRLRMRVLEFTAGGKSLDILWNILLTMHSGLVDLSSNCLPSVCEQFS